MDQTEDSMHLEEGNADASHHNVRTISDILDLPANTPPVLEESSTVGGVELDSTSCAASAPEQSSFASQTPEMKESQSIFIAPQPHEPSIIRRLSASKMFELANSMPTMTIPPDCPVQDDTHQMPSVNRNNLHGYRQPKETFPSTDISTGSMPNTKQMAGDTASPYSADGLQLMQHRGKRARSMRTVSSPPASRRNSATLDTSNTSTLRRHSNSQTNGPLLSKLNIDKSSSTPHTRNATQPPQQMTKPPESDHSLRSPIPHSIPLPPMSMPTLLQLELAGHRPSPLYIYHTQTSEIPYESSAVKLERLKNFLLLPTYLERTMNFGALACLDAWLWTLTILPMRFCIAFSILAWWFVYVIWKEAKWLTSFVWAGLGRMWKRGREGPQLKKSPTDIHRTLAKNTAPGGVEKSSGLAEENSPKTGVSHSIMPTRGAPTNRGGCTNQTGTSSRDGYTSCRQKLPSYSRTASVPSSLTPFHKADLLQGAVIICSSVFLMNLDASRMYHFIRAQSAVKLYVIYNLVEVGDRLLSALGQDVFECLLSSETLSRTATGRSKILLPFGMFLLSLIYNVAHSVVLFYQVITLNVAVNSYSNALLSLLMSNQFVEVKSSVFKRTEKENTFQLACADIVERFQLWIVLFIIALRNIVEIGGLSVPGAGGDPNIDVSTSKVPLHNTSILPASFTILPSWLISGEVLSPFLIVIGSEMVVDWIKHAYINKFNNIKPNFYGRILDILCKDYYTNAFVAPALTRRLGLPLIPLCTLFIRTSVQTYHMFLASHLSSPLPAPAQTSLVVESGEGSSSPIAASLERIDTLIRNALGRSVYGHPSIVTGESSPQTYISWSSDDIIAGVTMVVVFFMAFLVLLIAKLLLGMALLRYSRDRYVHMKKKEYAETAGEAEAEIFDAKGKRVGGYGKVEVGEDRRRWIFHDDPAGLAKLREKERRETGKGKKDVDLNKVSRYEMIAKRIW